MRKRILMLFFLMASFFYISGCNPSENNIITPPIILENDDFVTEYEVGSIEPDWTLAITATDKQDLAIVITEDFIDTSNVDMNTVGTFDVIFNVTNSKDKTTTKIISITIVDTTAPELNGVDSLTFEVGTVEPDWLSYVTVSDNNDDITLTLDNVDTSLVDMNTIGSFEVTYTVTDSNGNIGTKVIVVNIVDTTDPVLTGDDTLSFEVGTIEPDWLSYVTVSDNYDGIITLTLDNVDTTIVDMNTVGSFNVTFTVTDSSGNIGTKVIVVNIVDTTDPVLTGDDTLSFEVGTVEPDWLSYVTVSDNYDDIITLTLDNVDTTTVDMNTVGTFLVTYSVADTFGNTSTHTINVTIVDTTAPVLTGEDTLTYDLGTDEPDWILFVTASDNYDGNLTIALDNIDTSEVDMDTVGAFEVIYTLTDSNGNIGTKVILVNIVDIIDPIINGPDSYTLELGSEEPDWDSLITVSDNYDVEVYVEVDLSSINLNNLGNYEIIYTATDSSNNSSTFTLSVSIVDTTAPLLTLIGDEEINILLGTEYVELGAIAIDNYDGDLTNNIVITGFVNIDIEGTYIITYSVTDSNNNSIQIERTLHVENDILIMMPDENLKSAILDYLRRDNGPVTFEEADGISYLYIYDYQIENLSGIEYLHNLISLDISDNLITDISPLGNLTELTSLLLDNNEISDISPLLTLEHLEVVIVVNNPIVLTEGSINETVVLNFIQNNVICDLNGQLIEDDYSDIPTGATPINVNSVTPGLFDYSLDSDYFLLTLNETKMVNIYSSYPSNTIILVYNNSLEILLEEYDSFYFNELQPGNYYIRLVGGFIETPVNYELFIDEIIDCEISFNDSNLEDIIRDEVGIFDRPLLKSDVSKITLLDLDDQNINDLTGIENLINLGFLFLGYNNITDITPLLELNNLSIVLLSNNPIDLTEGTDNYNVIITFIDNDVTCDLNGLFIDDDHSDSSTDATLITIDTIISGEINYIYDKDYFVFTLTEYTTLNLSILDSSGLVEIMIYDENLEYIDKIDYHELTKRVSLNVGTYYMEISERNIISYQFTLSEYIPLPNEIIFEDIYFEEAIRNFLGIYNGPILIQNVIGITDLYLSYYDNITDITGIEYFTSLTILDLSYNTISDLTPISSLQNLQILYLEGNQISDLTPLSSLNNLIVLSLSNNQISDISCLSNLPNLIELLIDNNQITDITPLANLDLLYYIHLRNNPIDLSEASDNYNILYLFYSKYVQLDLQGLFITDDHSDLYEYATEYTINTPIVGSIDYNYDQDYFTFTLYEATSLKFYCIDSYLDIRLFDSSMNLISENQNNFYITLTEGTYYLNISSYDYLITYQYAIEDYTPGVEVIFNDINLENAIRHQIGKYGEPIYVEDVEFLEELLASGYNISDLSGIEQLTNLKYLSLNNNQITDISLLSTLYELEYLELMDNQITDITALIDLPILFEVFLENNPITVEVDNENYNTLQYLNNNYVYCDIYYLLPDDYGSDSLYASEILLNSEILGQIDYYNDEDWFVFTITETRYIVVSATSQDYIWMFLYDEDINEISNGNIYYSILVELQPGTYYLSVSGDSLNYQLLINEYNPQEEIIFNDQNLELAIREELNIYNQPILVGDVIDVWDLYLGNNGITDLTGLEHFINLRSIDLYENEISDISVLSQLMYLEEIYLEYNQITDITPLLNIESLGEVMLYGNPIDLTEGNNNYQVITYFIDNNINCDLNGYLDPNVVRFNDYHLETAIKSSLGIYNRPIYISDIDSVTMLYLEWYEISDLTGIEQFTNLRTLYLSYNNITDLSPLSQLHNLSSLNLYSNQITDVSPLGNLTNLYFLILGSNQISDITSLSGLINLNYLYLDNNLLTDIVGLESLNLLESLILSDNQITDLTPIANLSSIIELDATFNQISDISILSNLVNLYFVLLQGNPIDLTEGNDNYNQLLDFYNLEIICDITGIFIDDDHSDVYQNATIIDIESIIAGNIDYQFDQDYFELTIVEDTHLRFYLNPWNHVIINLFNETMDPVDINYSYSRYDVNLIPGTYYVNISGFIPESYEISVMPSYPEDIITFNDQNLEQAIRDYTGIYDSPLFIEDLEMITGLSIINQGLVDLTGIEYLTNLEYLDLINNNITDITPLLNLTNLNNVNLYGNPIDLTEGNGNYNVLQYFVDNNIYCDLLQYLPDEYGNSPSESTIIPLNSSLSGLINYIGDEDWFVFTIDVETTVMIYATGDMDNYGKLYDDSLYLIDESDDSYESLNFEIYITLQPGTYYLNVHGFGHNSVGVYKLHVEEMVDPIIFNDISFQMAVQDYTRIIGRPIYQRDVEHLTFLDISNRGITDLTGIEYFTGLNELYINDNPIISISNLSNLSNLQVLSMKNTDVLDISPLQNIMSLEAVYLEGNNLDLAIDSINYNVLMTLINNGVATDISGQFITDDHSDLLENALEFSLDSDINAMIDYGLDKDWFSFTITEDRIVTIYTSGFTDTYGILYDENNQIIAMDYDEHDGLNFSMKVVLEAGTYYLLVNAEDYYMLGQYTLHLVDNGGLTPVTFIDANLELAIRDHLNVYDRPLLISDLESIVDLDASYYGVTDISQINLLTNLISLYLSYNQITDITPLLTLQNLSEVYLNNNLINLTEGNDNYNVLLYFVSNGVWCDLYDYLSDDHGNSSLEATSITLNSSISGHIHTIGDEDYFVFTLDNDTTVNIYTTGLMDTFGELYDENLNTIVIDDDNGEELNFYIEINLAPGTYYLNVHGYAHEAIGGYELYIAS